MICFADMDGDNDEDFFQISVNFDKSIFYNQSSATKPVFNAPDGLNSIRRGRDVILSWNEPAGATDKGVSYDIMIGTTEGGHDIVTPLSQINTGYRLVPQPGPITGNSYRVTIPLKGTYYWKVQAINNSNGGSLFSESGTIVIGDYFVELANPFIPARYQINFDWGDYDSDGDQDLLFAGNYVESDWVWFNNVYENTGNGTFNPVPVFSLGDMGFDLRWIDLDNDNDMDIAAIVGQFGQRIVMFENNGSGVFTKEYDETSYGMKFTFGDFNNDGLTDLLFPNSIILINEGSFTFSTLYHDLPIFKPGDRSWDLNRDMGGDLVTFDGEGTLKLYEKTEEGFAVHIPSIPKFMYHHTEFDIGDFDNDRNPDIILSGNTDVEIKETMLLRNTGSMNFQRINTFFRGTTYGSVSSGDYDNDNDLDVLLSGQSFSLITKIYDNKGNMTFEEIDYMLPGLWQGKSGWADFDEDGDLDLLLSGTNSTYGANSKLFRNDLNIPAATVNAPENLSSSKEGYGILLTWQDVRNTGVSYNVRVGTSPGAYDIVSPESDIITGKRKVTRIGNTDLNMSYQLNTLPVGTYYWSVQAVNNAFKGSPWAPEESFTITVVNAGFSATESCFGTATQFTDNTIVQGESIVNWLWEFGDGQTASTQDPSHIYATDGTYQVTLTVNTQNYSDVITKDVIVKKKPSANFTATTVCNGSPTSFTNSTNNNGLTISLWSWDFGDSHTSSLQNPGSNTYSFAGEYTVSLGIQADNGCTDEISKTVTVAGYPVAAVSADGATTFCSGQNVTLSTPLSAQYTYLWKRDGANITGATSNSYTASISGSYNVAVNNTVGNCLTNSSAVAVTANSSPAAPLITNSGPLTFCQGESVVLSVTYTDGYFYQWKLNGGAVGTSSNTYTATASGTYSIEVANSSGCKTNSSNTVDVTVNSLPSIPTVNISGPTTFCQGSSVELSVAPTGGYTYQWENNGSAITGANSNTYLASSSGIYSLKITNSSNCSSKTENVTVTVLPSPTAPTISADGAVTFCNGESVGLSVTGTTGYSYQWKLNGGAVGSNSNSFTATASGTYTLVVTNSSLCSVDATNSIAVTVNPKPTVPTVNISGPTAFCEGGNVELSITTTPGYEYQWENNGSGITGAIYNSFIAQASGNYTLRVTNSYSCFAKTENVAVTVAAAPSAPLISTGGPQIFCQGDSVELSITPTSGYNYQWKLNGGTIGTNSHLLNAKSAGTYSLTVANDIGCSANSTNTVDITVNSNPSLPTVNLSGATSFCQGGSVDLSVTSTAGYTYQWENNGAAISGASSNTLTANTSGIYSLKIINTNNCYVKTENVTVNVLTVPSAPAISAASATTFCQGDSVLLSVTNTSGYSYQWRLNGGSVGTNSNLYVAKSGGSYDLVVANTNGCAAASAAPVPVIVKPLPVKSNISLKGDARFCSGGSATLSIPVNESYSYSWKKGTTDLGLSTNTIDVTETGSYFVEINLAGCTASADPVSIEVIGKPAKPDIDMGTYKPDDCLGETPPVLTVDNIVPGYTYQWYKNETPISTSTSIEVIESGNYYLEARYDICASERNLAGITFAEAPPKPVITPKGPTVWLLSTDSKADRYVWYYNGAIILGASGSSYLAGQNYGLYRLAVANEAGCFSFSDTLRIPTGITGIQDVDPFENVKIYPNPTTGLFTIEMNNNVFGELVIDIFTQNGSKILNIKFQKTTEYFQSQIDLSGQSSGMYILNLGLDKFRAVRKVLVE